jgi:methylated-DNA-[protein]-cysteine S-methyltransferase
VLCIFVFFLQGPARLRHEVLVRESHYVFLDCEMHPEDSVANSLQLLLDRLETPIGEMLIVVDEDGRLRAVDWTDHEARMRRFLRLHYGEKGFRVEEGRSPYLKNALTRYFTGELTAIDALPVKTAGTPFQRKVWSALRDIPCGETLTYSELAGRIGHPDAVRAVGSANGANPVGVVVPCHRVVGANGSLTGYGGGIERKSWLLKHESARAISGNRRRSRSGGLRSVDTARGRWS